MSTQPALRLPHPEPLQLLLRRVAQPFHLLPLRADGHRTCFEWFDQLHVLTQPDNHGYIPALTNLFLPSHVNVGLVTHHHFRHPVQVLVTVMNAGMEEQSVPTVGRRYPRYQCTSDTCSPACESHTRMVCFLYPTNQSLCPALVVRFPLLAR